MAKIYTVSEKGAPLTISELDQNFINLSLFKLSINTLSNEVVINLNLKEEFNFKDVSKILKAIRDSYFNIINNYNLTTYKFNYNTVNNFEIKFNHIPNIRKEPHEYGNNGQDSQTDIMVGACLKGDNIYFAPFKHKALGQYNYKTNTFTFVGQKLSYNIAEPICVVGSDKIFLLPFQDDKLFIFNPDYNSYQYIHLKHHNEQHHQQNNPDVKRPTIHSFGGTSTLDGRIVFAPFISDVLVIYNKNTNITKYYQLPEQLHSEEQMFSGCQLDFSGEFVYTTPWNSKYILQYNTDLHNMELLENPYYDGTEKQFRGSVLLNNKIYFAPYNSNYILILDTYTLEFSKLDIEKDGQYCGVNIMPNGNLCFIPYTENRIMILDPIKFKLDYYNIKNHNVKCLGGATSPDGKLWFTPTVGDGILNIEYNRMPGNAILNIFNNKL